MSSTMNTNDLLKQISTTVTEAGKGGWEKAKEIRDSAMITLEIRDRENTIQRAYRELGRAYYRAHRNDEEPEYDQIIFIKAAFEEIGELKAAKDDLRGIRRCPKCGAPIQNNANFCPNCGEKYDLEEMEAEEEAEEAAEDEAEEFAEKIVEAAMEAEDEEKAEESDQ